MRRFPATMVLAVVVMAAVSACVPNNPGAARPGSAPFASATTAPAPSAPASGTGHAALTITLKQSAGAAPVVYTLVCTDGVPAPASDLPTAVAACAALAKNPLLLTRPSPPAGQLCTEQFGGPQQATVSGTVDGTAVQASYSLRDGCEISAWDAVQSILGAAGGAS
ncbi:MAG: serine protease inhibitor [Specibacter sp.]